MVVANVDVDVDDHRRPTLPLLQPHSLMLAAVGRGFHMERARDRACLPVGCDFVGLCVCVGVGESAFVRRQPAPATHSCIRLLS